MRKLIAFILAIVLALSLTACGGDSLKVGDTVQFGELDWLVLAVEGDKALLLSKDLLEMRRYHDVYTWITWEDSDIRQYLNGEFYNGFSAEEKGWIVETSLLTGGYSEDSKSSIDTTDNNIPVGQQ